MWHQQRYKTLQVFIINFCKSKLNLAFKKTSQPPILP